LLADCDEKICRKYVTRGHYGDHSRRMVADRGSPWRMVKEVAPDEKGAADRQRMGEGKLLISSRDRRSSLGELFISV